MESKIIEQQLPIEQNTKNKDKEWIRIGKGRVGRWLEYR